MTFTTGYLWAFSTVTKAALQTEATDYRIQGNTVGTYFAWVSDQLSPILRWKDPQQEGSEHPRRGRYSRLWDGSQKADGYWQGVLCFAVLTPLAWGQIDYNQFSDGAVEYAAATIQVPNEPNQAYTESYKGWSAFTCTMHRPIPGQDFEYRDGLFINVKYRWDMGTLIT